MIEQMVAMTQEDLPYLVLTEDPDLQAYRTDRIETIAPICPAETGDLFCDAGLARRASWRCIRSRAPATDDRDR